jgi:hypothetical protein
VPICIYEVEDQPMSLWITAVVGGLVVFGLFLSMLSSSPGTR